MAASHLDWLRTLSPWPEDGFGLGRMRELLARLDNPQEAFEAVHVVGTNGKSTATRTVEALLRADGRSVGATVSPHVRRWAERITIGGREADLEGALARVRHAAEEVRATQFETITAAGFAAFADAGVEVAAVEAGLGGRHDATNVLRTRVVLLTNVGLDHTDVLGTTIEAIAREKLAVVHGDSIVVLPDDTFTALVEGHEVRLGGAREAAEAFAGHPIEAEVDVRLPGRLELRPGPPAEIRDGAHNPDGAGWLVQELEAMELPRDRVVVASVLADKDAPEMLRRLGGWADRLVATTSSNPRALPAADLARLAAASGCFADVSAVEEPVAALERGRRLAGAGGVVLVTGSLYVLADLATGEAQ